MKQTLNVALEIKSLGAREFEGHGSIFGNVDLGGDIVMPGAFKRSLAKHKKEGTLPQMFWMHRPDQVPGRWIDMEEDAKGLYVRGELADTQLGNELHTLLKMKAVRGQSIGYQTIESDWTKDGNRLLKEVDLWEVSLVSLAMNPLAQIEAVKSRLSSAGEYVPTEREFERLMREVGCSKSVSRVIASSIIDAGSVKAIDADLRTAIAELGNAIDLHQKHMDGTEPTDMASQKKMMRMMERAFEALTSKPPGNMMKGVSEFERILRDAGCARKVAATLAAKLYGPDSISGMLDDHLRDAGEVDGVAEAKAAAEAVAAKFATAGLKF